MYINCVLVHNKFMWERGNKHIQLSCWRNVKNPPLAKPLMKGHFSFVARFGVQYGWLHKKGTTVIIPPKPPPKKNKTCGCMCCHALHTPLLQKKDILESNQIAYNIYPIYLKPHIKFEINLFIGSRGSCNKNLVGQAYKMTPIYHLSRGGIITHLNFRVLTNQQFWVYDCTLGSYLSSTHY